MPERTENENRKSLERLRETLAESAAGQTRLDHIVNWIVGSMQAEVCSIYLYRDSETLELCVTEGLKAESVNSRTSPLTAPIWAAVSI